MTVLVACTTAPVRAPAPAPVTPATTTLDSYVIDEHGPVANAELRLMAVPAHACPCTAEDLASASPMNALPDCQCPAALAMWMDELDRCDPPAVLATARTNTSGRTVVPIVERATILVAATPTAERWLRMPANQAPIAIELATLVVPHVTIDSHDGGLRGALMFADGHCTRLVRDRTGFVAERPVPTPTGDADATLVFASPSGVVVHRWHGELDVELEYHPSMSVHETCDDPDQEVKFDSPFQHVKTRADAKGAFHFDGLLGFTGEVTCEASGDTFYFAPGELSRSMSGGSLFGDECFDVEVVDPRGRPVAGAAVSAMHGMGGNMSSGTVTKTDAHGRTCVDSYSDSLTVEAPDTVGGGCAGREEHKLTRVAVAATKPTRPLQITLHTRALHRSSWTGRVVSPEHLPVAGALVRVSGLEPRATPGCEARGDFETNTGLDGTFTLPMFPDGKLGLEVFHDWYRTTPHEIVIGGPTRDLVVDRGASWTGRVFDPDGHAFAHCNIFIQQPSSGYIKMVPCTTGFTFGALPQGDLAVSVHVERGPLGTRVLRQTVHITGNAQLHDDVRFPRGATIAGVVIDAAGAPLAHARVDAIPKTSARLSDRLSDGEIQLETDANGHFELRHLTPGMWALRGNHRGLAGHDFDIATGTIDVRLVVAK